MPKMKKIDLAAIERPREGADAGGGPRRRAVGYTLRRGPEETS
jgi:hypothetical protein